MRGAIWAQTPSGIIGVNGAIPWRYPGDFRRFKRLTLGCAIVMGRKTFESIGKPLPGRRNVIVTSRLMGPVDADVVHSFDAAVTLLADVKDVWFIGGRSIYEAALPIVDVVDVTRVPEIEWGAYAGKEVVRAPWVPDSLFRLESEAVHDDESELRRVLYVSHRLAEVPYEMADNRRLQEAGTLTRKRP